MLKDQFQKRFSELEVQYSQLSWKNPGGAYERFTVAGEWQRWGTSAQNLIRAVYGFNSPHYKNFEALFQSGSMINQSETGTKAVYGFFQSAKNDFEGGYVFDVEKQVSGEVVGDFVSMAKLALREGIKDVAAVLACAALEDALKRYATLSGLTIDGKSMQEVINALKSKGLIEGPMKSLLGSMPEFRNSVMHADWGKVTPENTGAAIGFVEQFLLTKFG